MSVRWNGAEVKAKIRAAAERGVKKGAEHLLTESRKVVPIEEGVLERSGVATTDGTRAAVSYDGPYAARQHEELDWQHDAGRTAKYLERPMHEEAPAIRAIIAREVKKTIT